MTGVHDDEREVICGNADCRVAENGRCVEGLEPDECPRYGRKAVDESQGVAVDERDLPEGDEESVQLQAGDRLTPSQASRLLRAGDARVIAILGPVNSGKTTLIASLYDLFQTGPVSGLEFSASQTLCAFEHVCHDARSASRRSVPDMNRTPLGGVRFYHLQIGGASAGDGLSLMIGDRSGEEYQDAAADASNAPSFLEVARADSLTVLVDGERLADIRARHNLRGEIILMMQALHDANRLRLGSRLALVLTKLDAVRNSPHAERAVCDFDGLLTDLRRRFSEAFSVIESFQIAASPMPDTLTRGTGVPELLLFWLQPAVPPAYPGRPNPSLERAFSRVMPLEESTD